MLMAKNLVSEEAVRAVPQPAYTKTWHPISHGRVLDAADVALESYGVKVVGKSYGLAQDGNVMAACWQLNAESGGHISSVAILNSTNMRSALKLAAGAVTPVCTNLSISGDFVSMRKHTNGLDDETLAELMDKAMGELMERLVKFANRMRILGTVGLMQNSFERLVYRLVLAGAIPQSQFMRFHEAWRAEKLLSDEDQNTLYTLNAAVTRHMRGESLTTIVDRNRRLHDVMNAELAERNVKV